MMGASVKYLRMAPNLGCTTHTMLYERDAMMRAKTYIHGEWGYRSPYLSHAKRALYHLS